ncbi:HNH endonuclease signature motif containing protein [Nocardioides nanhaiensis]|uniref:HNH endonuclease signature motif containing protein n=1 Tax=Nocardioides nanhaiensis TaxID=1476871 RepID=UPI0031EED638
MSAEVIREWCGTAGRITVRPVIDLNGAVHVEQYEVPDRLKQRSRWTDPRCVYPHCNRPADRCDCDHIQPFEQGGATCSCNLPRSAVATTGSRPMAPSSIAGSDRVPTSGSSRPG